MDFRRIIRIICQKLNPVKSPGTAADGGLFRLLFSNFSCTVTDVFKLNTNKREMKISTKFFADMKQTAAAAATGAAATGTAASQRSENSVTMEANQQRQAAIQAGLSGAQAAKQRPLVERPAEREASVEEQRAAMKARVAQPRGPAARSDASAGPS